MGKFTVSLSEMQGDANEMSRIVSSLRRRKVELDSLRSKVQTYSARAGKRISNINNQLEAEATKLSHMSQTLQCVTGLYERAENEVLENSQPVFDIWNGLYEGVIDLSSPKVVETLEEMKDKKYAYSAIWPGIIGAMFIEDIESSFKSEHEEKDTLLGRAEIGEVDGGKYGFGTHDKKNKDVLGLKREYKYDEKEGKFVEKEPSKKKKTVTEKDIAENITIAEFKYSFLDEDEKGIVIGETKDGGKITLDKRDLYIKNKLTAGSWEAAFGGAYSMLSIETEEQKVGDDLFGAHASATVDILATSASLKAGVGWMNEEGQIDPHLYGGMGAEAVVAKVSGEVGVDLLGTDVDIKGSVGIGVGFHADAGIDDGVLKLNLGGYIGIGGDVSLELDLSGTIETVEKVVDFAGDAIGVIGDAVGAVGDAVKEGAKFIGKIGSAISNGWKKFSLW